MVRILSPNGDRHYKTSNFTSANQSKFPVIDKARADDKVAKLVPKPTFDCYRNPMGPDVRLDNKGPEYKIRDYKHKEYKPRAPHRTHKNPTTDPLKSRPTYAGRPTQLYKGDVAYKLDTKNNAAMRNWNYGFVNDTVAAKRSHTKPQDKYIVPQRSHPRESYTKPVQSKPEQKPQIFVAAPKEKTKQIPPPPTAPPPPNAKSYRSTSTQNGGPDLKTITTQTKVSKTKTTSMQTEETTQSLPVIAPAPVPKPTKKVSTKTKCIQCSIEPKKEQVYKQRTPSPEVAKTTNENKQKCVSFKSPTQTQTVQQPTPEITSQPTNMTSQSTYRFGLGMFPYPSARSRLPPEITANIEAYDNAHGPVKV